MSTKITVKDSKGSEVVITDLEYDMDSNDNMVVMAGAAHYAATGTDLPAVEYEYVNSQYKSELYDAATEGH